MRSSRAKPTKSVSICSDPVTENGPCTKKEDVNEGQQDAGAGAVEAHAVAAQFVEDVVRLASQAVLQRVASSGEETSQELLPLQPETQSTTSQTKQETRNLQRLPTIQIDPVPSMPSSPTEWPSPPPEATIPEEDEEEIETLEEGHIELDFQEEDPEVQEEVQKFAAAYVEDLISKALDIAEERRKTQDAEQALELAKQVVDDVISRASESAADISTMGLKLPDEGQKEDDIPTIQIDTVASLPPSPSSDEERQLVPEVEEGAELVREEQTEVETAKEQDKEIEEVVSQVRPAIPEIICGEYEEPPEVVEDKAKELIQLVKYGDAPKELQELASSYVKDVISKAVTMAEEKAVHAVPHNFEDVDLMKTNGPWYIRAREAFMRVLRSACFCTPRRNDS